jgi:hypothetical protein
MSTPGLKLKRAQIQHLRTEIDRLAVMLFEVKSQAEKIQAAADALGDAVLAGLNVEESGGDGSSVLVFPENTHWKKRAAKKSSDTA